MSQTYLSLTSLQEMDNGKVVAAVDHAIRQVVNDCIDRPGDKSKRKVLLQIEMKPVLDKDLGVLDTVNSKFRVKTNLPDRETVEYPMLPTQDGRLAFSPHSPGDPRQADLPYEPPANAEAVDRETGEVTPAPDRD